MFSKRQSNEDLDRPSCSCSISQLRKRRKASWTQLRNAVHVYGFRSRDVIEQNGDIYIYALYVYIYVEREIEIVYVYYI
jgi:hypothetical protein